VYNKNWFEFVWARRSADDRKLGTRLEQDTRRLSLIKNNSNDACMSLFSRPIIGQLNVKEIYHCWCIPDLKLHA
jgi:hypothetical protein